MAYTVILCITGRIELFRGVCIYGSTRNPTTLNLFWPTSAQDSKISQEAVKKEADLVVYYFVDHVGRGKAQSFATAGQDWVLARELKGWVSEFIYRVSSGI